MARPKGRRMNGDTFKDVLFFKEWNMSRAADELAVPLSTLSGLAAGTQVASDQMAAQICSGLGVRPASLFPSLAGFTDPPRIVRRKEEAAA